MTAFSTRDTDGIARALSSRDPFDTHGALRGRPHAVGPGWLPADWSRTYQARRGVISYTVCSYDTPIAWLDSEIMAWVVPSESYSVTTSRHQSRVRRALSLTGEDIHDA